MAEDIKNYQNGSNTGLDDTDMLIQLGKGGAAVINTAKFKLPVTDDFYVDDVSPELMKKLADSLDSTASNQGAMFYCETPYSTQTGYYDEAKVLIVRATPIMPGKGDVSNQKKGVRADALNEFDGDTVYFSIGTIDDGNQPITIDDVQYANLKKFIMGNISVSAINEEKFGLRFVGVNAPEIPHYTLVPSLGATVVEVNFNDIVDNNNYLYDHSLQTHKSPTKFVKLGTTYHEIVEENYTDDKLKESIEKAKAANASNPQKLDDINKTTYYKVVYTDESATYSNAQNGLAAKSALRDLVSRAEDIVLMLDHKTINRKSGSYPSAYNAYTDDFFVNPFNILADPIKSVSTLWDQLFGPSGFRYLGFNMYGQDAYKRFLGCMYVKTYVSELGQTLWVNAGKYLISKVTEGYTVLPSYSSDPMTDSKSSFLSDAFKLWSYNTQGAKIIDSLTEISKSDFDDRRAIQKQITGIDFDQMKDWTVMIGDCLLMVPPTSIRVVTQSQNERVPVIRSRGSMVKGAPRSEKLIEMTLYFNNEDGINGRPYTTKLPNGEEITYYMNGLRTLISMFKLTPFMPIESQYINNTLNVEAVSLVNMQISTIPGYPTCIAAVLTLQEFNYHIYMPEIPTPDLTDESSYDINLFARTINYETMRWYYQRPILKGNELASYAFDSKKYLEETFGHQTALIPMKFQTSDVEFYIPDKEYLDQLLQVKLEAMEKPLMTQSPITEEAKKWAKQLSYLFDKVKSLGSNSNYTNAMKAFEGGDYTEGRLALAFEFDYRYGDTIGGWLVNTLKDKPNARISESNYAWMKDVKKSNGKYKTEQVKSPQEVGPMLDTIYDKIWDHFKGYVEDFWMDKEFVEGDSSTSIDTWHIDLGVLSDIIPDSTAKSNFLKVVAGEIGKPVSEFYDEENDRIKLIISAPFAMSTNKDSWGVYMKENYSLDTSCAGYMFLQKVYATYGVEGPTDFASDASDYGASFTSDEMQDILTEQKQALDLEKNQTLKFVKYPIGTVRIKSLSAVYGNTLSRMSLKALDGFAPQYCGGQDTAIEVSMETTDRDAVQMLDLLPKMATQYMRDYRLILSCWPLRMNSEISKVLGVNEVLIESVDISTVPGQPGLFNIEMRLMSVDRTARNSEALKRLDINNSGSKSIQTAATYDTKNFFDLKKTIAQAEVYPDLELPTLDELEAKGFKFIRYINREKFRKYPDPDFYFVYGHTLGHQVFRETVLHFVNSNVPQPEFRLTDRYGASIDIRGAVIKDTVGKAYEITDTNDQAKLMASQKDVIQAAVDTVLQKKMDEKKNAGGTNLDNMDMISLYSSLDQYQTWDVSTSVKCMFREKRYEKLLTKDDQLFIDKIKTRADEIKKLTDELLSKPIDMSKAEKWSSMGYIKSVNDRGQFVSKMTSEITDAVNDMLCQGPVGRILDLLEVSMFPEVDSADAEMNGAYAYSDPDKQLSNEVINMVMAAADAASGEAEFADSKDKLDWQMKMYVNAESIIKESAAHDPANFYDYALVPYCKISVSNGGNVGIKLASSLEEAVKLGTAYGPFQIKLYDKAQIQNIEGNVAPKTNLTGLFLDPYYRNRQINNGNDDQEVLDYKRAILMDPYLATIAYFRNTIYWLNKLVQDGILMAVYELIQNEAREVLNKTTYHLSSTELQAAMYDQDAYNAEKAEEQAKKDAEEKAYLETLSKEDKKKYEEAKKKAQEEIAKQEEADRALADQIRQNIEDGKKPLGAGKFFASIIMVLTSGSESVYNYMKDRNYDILNQMIRGAQLPTSGGEYELMRKYVLALVGRGVIGSTSDIGASSPTASAIVGNIINEAVCLAAAEDPRIYLRDSFYDMIINDKRGRMLRAFPTFYMVFIDEGREIGLWKLHDNFYNMSSISEIQVTKSRKIAADTAHITMTNLFKTYTTDDEDSKEMAMDIDTLKNFQYTWKDVFNSIFSPRTYYMKEELLKMNQLPIERAQLKPGVRVHLRMGYGADASDLPIVFNGVVAEVGSGELVEIVCQGDGIELTNPILTTTDAEDVAYQDDFVIGRIFENWLTKGATPRTILGSLLTTKGGWLKKTIYNITNGRFFNQNPYGIVHFGDPMYTDIFQGSECVQNIYEAAQKPSWGDDKMNDYITPYYETKDTPKLSAHVFGKSYWDLMGICAGSCPDYIASTAPFGLRSSIFYGAPHYYYAYDYSKELVSSSLNEETQAKISSLEQAIANLGGSDTAIRNDMQKQIDDLKATLYANNDYQTWIREKRKPFQQYHIYTSYSDIINNCIKTSSKDVRTCAVGLYQRQGAFGKENMDRVGPMWVDFDIYPEHQRTMTVDTQFLAKGVPVLGDIIPFLNTAIDKLGKDVGMYTNNGYEIAWRITATALKNSVKDMYQGELIVIGDPSVKPYDKMWIEDMYERMQGCCEVEAVVHNFSVENGYTTSVFADCIATIDDRHEQIAHNFMNSIVAKGAAAYCSLAILSLAFTQRSRPLIRILTKWAESGTVKATEAINAILGFFNQEELLQNETILAKSDKLKSILGINNLTYKYNLYMQNLETWRNALDDLKKGKISGLTDLADYYESLSKSVKNISADDLIKSLTDAKANASASRQVKIQSAIDQLTELQKTVNKEMGVSMFSKTDAIDDLKKIADAADAAVAAGKGGDEMIDAAKTFRAMAESGVKLDKADDLADFAKAMRTISTNVDNVDDLVKGTKLASQVISDIDKVKDVMKVADKTKDAVEGAKDIAKAAKWAATGTKAALASTVIGIVLEEAITTCLVGFAYEWVERWMKNLQVLQVWPLKRNGRVYTAGLDGSRGIVVGSPTENLEGLVEEWLGNVFTYKDGPGSMIYNTVIALFASQDMMDIASKYKTRNGLPDAEGSVESMTKITEDLMQHIAADEMKRQSGGYSSMLFLKRIKNLSDENEAGKAFSTYAISDIATLPINTQIKEDMILLSQSAQLGPQIGKHILLDHNNSSDIIKIDLEGTTQDIHMIKSTDKKSGASVIDLPLVRPDLHYLLCEIYKNLEVDLGYSEDEKKYYEMTHTGMQYDDPFVDHPMIIHSALRAGDSSWHCTGFGCFLEVKNYDLEALLKKTQEEQFAKLASGNYFEYVSVDGSKSSFKIMVHPPADYSTTNSSTEG